jgi:hypothetical protein
MKLNLRAQEGERPQITRMNTKKRPIFRDIRVCSWIHSFGFVSMRTMSYEFIIRVTGNDPQNMVEHKIAH